MHERQTLRTRNHYHISDALLLHCRTQLSDPWHACFRCFYYACLVFFVLRTRYLLQRIYTAAVLLLYSPEYKLFIFSKHDYSCYYEYY